MHNFGQYKDDTDIGSRPIKPRLSIKHTPEDVLEYHANLINYQNDLNAWKEKLKKKNEKEQVLLAKFKTDLFEDLGIQDHPKKELLYSKAWERGHAHGFAEVYNHACDLAELID
jgi:hypothetical protein